MTSRSTVLSVILSLAALTALALAGTIWLAHEVISAQGPVDAAEIALITGLSSLAGVGLGAIAGVLASTKSLPEPPAPGRPVELP